MANARGTPADTIDLPERSAHSPCSTRGKTDLCTGIAVECYRSGRAWSIVRRTGFPSESTVALVAGVAERRTGKSRKRLQPGAQGRQRIPHEFFFINKYLTEYPRHLPGRLPGSRAGLPGWFGVDRITGELQGCRIRKVPDRFRLPAAFVCGPGA